MQKEKERKRQRSEREGTARVRFNLGKVA